MRCNGCGKLVKSVSCIGIKGRNLRFHNKECIEKYNQFIEELEKKLKEKANKAVNNE